MPESIGETEDAKQKNARIDQKLILPPEKVYKINFSLSDEQSQYRTLTLHLRQSCLEPLPTNTQSLQQKSSYHHYNIQALNQYKIS